MGILETISIVVSTLAILIGGVWALVGIAKQAGKLEEKLNKIDEALGQFVNETRTEFKEIRKETQAEFKEIRKEVQAEFNEIRKEVQADSKERREETIREVNKINETLAQHSVGLSAISTQLSVIQEESKRQTDRINGNCEDIATLEELVRNHDRDIRIHTGEIEILTNKIMAQKASPLRLTEQGQKLFDDVDGAGFIKRHKQELIDYIKERNPRSRLDVEALASKAVYSLTDTDDFVHIKEYLYDAPEVPTQLGGTAPLGIIDVCGVIGLVLRDIYLEEIGVPPPPPLE